MGGGVGVSKYKVIVNDPALPDGHEIEVPGLGVFENRSTRQLSEEDAEYFRDVNARIVDVETDDRPAWTGAAGVELRRGPTVLDAFRDHPTVSVEAVEPSTKARAPKDSGEKKEKES
jgi:hypothetical protein